MLTILPEALRGFDDYRMLAYAIVLILVMLATNNAQFKALFSKPLRSIRALASRASSHPQKGAAASGKD